MNWLMMMLVPRMTGTDEMLLPLTNDWKNPVCQTLSMRTNIAAKKTSVGQSMARRMANRRGEKRRTGAAAQSAIRGSVTGIVVPASDETIFTAASTKMIASEHFVRKKRESSQAIIRVRFNGPGRKFPGIE